MNKEITIYDIAKKLSLSPATVSRALNDHPAVRKPTKKRVMDAAKELGYRSNTFASNLRTQQTKTIGIILHELNSNFITSVLAGIEKITTEAGYDLIIAHSSESYKKEAANAHNLFHKRVDGLIASLSFETTNLDHFKPFTEKNIPIVFFDRVDEKSDHLAVIIDNYKSGYKATQHLAQQGCKRIALVTASLQRNVYAERHRGYADALKDAGLTADKKHVLVSDLSEEAAILSANQILKMSPRPDGIFITNDFSAAVLMRTLKENGIKIPEDIAVVGFNNDAIGKLIEPSLTTIHYPGQEMGEIVAITLVNHLKGTSDVQNTHTIIIRSELIVRESSQKKKKHK
jgi:LacI family transcriptional regulator